MTFKSSVKRVLAFVMALVLCLALTACHKDAEEETTDAGTSGDSELETTTVLSEDYGSYDDLITTVAAGVSGGFTEEQEDELNLSYNIVHADPSYETIGYTELDLDGDGTKELLLGSNDTDGDASHIYNVYTLVDGQMVQVLTGWDRNCYYLCQDNIIANEGANGASNYCTTFYTYSAGTLTLKESVYYNADKDADNPWFYSTSAAFDENGKSISESEVNAITDAYDYQTLEFTALS